mmetsp:Transcript_5229/g.12748  ORF Transcript_5229/g.12748 Transcript_5229/m.12748 type:complete len:296 (+) Transcript_5229:142-1029(+)
MHRAMWGGQRSRGMDRPEAGTGGRATWIAVRLPPISHRSPVDGAVHHGLAEDHALRVDELGVDPFLLHELLVRAFLRDAAAVHDADAVRALHGRQAVRDHHHRLPLHQALDCLLHEALARRVQGARGLVQDDDRRVLAERAGDRHALPLAARKHAPAVPDVRVVALREVLDELVGVCEAGRLLDLLPRAVAAAAVGNVVKDCAVKQHRLLSDKRDGIRPRHGRELLSARPSEVHTTLVRAVELGDQRGDGALPAPAAADDRRHLSPLQDEVEVLQNRCFRPHRVAEPEVLQLQAA